MLGAFEIWPKAPDFFVRAVSPSQALEANDHCRANLAHFKMPKTLIFGELPNTSAGKVQKFKLQEQANNLKDDSV